MSVTDKCVRVCVCAVVVELTATVIERNADLEKCVSVCARLLCV